MWKKARTYYILLAIAMTTAMFFMDFATITDGEDSIGIKYYEKLAYLVMLIMLLTANILSFFTYKVPFLQSRVCMLTALLMLGFQIWLAIDFFSYNDQMTFSISAIFPIAGAILNAMASRSALVDGVTVTAYKALSKKKKKK